MMEIVINIPEELYEAYKGRPPMLGDTGMDMIAQSIANGTPLPKGHGKIIDESKINEVYTYTEENIINNIKIIRTTITHTDAPTIIEADVERSIIKEEIK